MSSGGQKKTRLERVAALEMPPNLVERMFGDLQRGDVLLRIGLCFLSAIFLWVVVGAWAPPFAISARVCARSRHISPRAV